LREERQKQQLIKTENMKAFLHLMEKFPKIIIMNITNGFLVAFLPENNDLQKMMATYVKDIMGMIQNASGDEWKTKMEQSIKEAMKKTGTNTDLIYICKDAIDVMKLIAPEPEGKKKKGDNFNRPDLTNFWSESGHIPE
jgi:hypothetical protein